MMVITKVAMIYSQFYMVIVPALVFGRHSGLFIVARLPTLAIGYLCPVVGSMLIMEL